MDASAKTGGTQGAAILTGIAGMTGHAGGSGGTIGRAAATNATIANGRRRDTAFYNQQHGMVQVSDLHLVQYQLL